MWIPTALRSHLLCVAYLTCSPSDLSLHRVRLCQWLGKQQWQRGERVGIRERREQGSLRVWGRRRGGGRGTEEEKKERSKEASARKRKVDCFKLHAMSGIFAGLWMLLLELVVALFIENKVWLLGGSLTSGFLWQWAEQRRRREEAPEEE